MTDKELKEKAIKWIRSQGWSEENLPNDEYIQMCDAYIAGAKELENEYMLKLKDTSLVRALKDSIIMNEKLSSQEQQELCAWIEAAMEFGENLDECAKENEQLKQQITEAKENGVVWHDLRKNPNDLPQKVGDYIVAIKFKYLKGCDTTILRYDEDEDEDKLSWIDSEYTNCNDDVIAWCEIPKFRVESK